TINRYLKEIGRVPLLTREEEVELAQTRDRGKEARVALEQLQPGEASDELQEAVAAGNVAYDHLVHANLRLVVSIAKKIKFTRHMSMLDLIQEGNIGLMRAAEKFDWQKGYKFSTYATWWIRQ